MVSFSKPLVILLLFLLSSGCSAIPPAIVTPGSDVPFQERQFAGALQFLRQGDEETARSLLEQVVESPQLAGLTDDALFRLAILRLRDGSVKGTKSASLLLTRLTREFPDSIWTYQAAPLLSFLSTTQKVFEQQREAKTLRTLNLHLEHENKELRLNLDKLKNLDLELEKRIKR
jgi:hypothetical protein